MNGCEVDLRAVSLPEPIRVITAIRERINQMGGTLEPWFGRL